MADTIVRCPECKTRLKVPAGKPAVRCPKCTATVRIPAAEPPEENPRPKARRPPVVTPEPPRARRRRDEDEDDDRPRRRPEVDEDEDDDRPRRRRERERDEDDDVPRRPRRRGRGSDDGPWVIVAAAVPVCFLLTCGGALLINGTAGLPAGQDGPGGKLAGLGIGFLVSLVLIGIGIVGVKNRRAQGKWGIEIHGTMGVLTGAVQAILGGLIAGITLYGLLFTLVNGR